MARKSAGKELINETFLEKVLTSSQADEGIKVTSYEIARATALGDNFASDMYRVSVQYLRGEQQETISLIVKAEPSNEVICKYVKGWDFFPRETAALSKIAPNIYSALQEASEERDKIQPFTAECYYSLPGPPVAAMVLQDLKALGFKMAERKKGLDFNHCSLVLRTLAKYHATSVFLYKRKPELFQTLEENIFQEKNKNDLETYYGQRLKLLASQISTWPECDERYATKLRKVSDIFSDYIMKSTERQDGDFNVLIHGDLWLNNMMFRYSESTSEVQDVRFVDFQLSNLTSAAFDLHYFLYTSSSPEVIDNHNTLIEEYHKTLGQTFTLLGQEHLHPTMEQLNKELDKKGLFAAVIACCILPVVQVNQDVFRKTLNKLLPSFEEKGWLEVDKYI